MDFPGFFDDLRRSDDIPQPPTGDGIGLGQGTTGQGPLPHPGQGGKIDVFIGFVDNVFVHFIGDHPHIVFFRQVCDGLEFLPGEHLAAGVGGVAQDHGLGMLPEGRLQHLWGEPVVRGHQRYVNGLCPAEDGVSPVVFIEGGKYDHFVPRIRHRHHRHHHGFRAAGGR